MATSSVNEGAPVRRCRTVPPPKVQLAKPGGSSGDPAIMDLFRRQLTELREFAGAAGSCGRLNGLDGATAAARLRQAERSLPTNLSPDWWHLLVTEAILTRVAPSSKPAGREERSG